MAISLLPRLGVFKALLLLLSLTFQTAQSGGCVGLFTGYGAQKPVEQNLFLKRIRQSQREGLAASHEEIWETVLGLLSVVNEIDFYWADSTRSMISPRSVARLFQKVEDHLEAIQSDNLTKSTTHTERIILEKLKSMWGKRKRTFHRLTPEKLTRVAMSVRGLLCEFIAALSVNRVVDVSILYKKFAATNSELVRDTHALHEFFARKNGTVGEIDLIQKRGDRLVFTEVKNVKAKDEKQRERLFEQLAKMKEFGELFSPKIELQYLHFGPLSRNMKHELKKMGIKVI